MTKRPIPRRTRLETFNNTPEPEPEYEKIKLEQEIKQKLDEDFDKRFDQMKNKFFTVTWVDWVAVSLLVVILLFLVMDRQRVLAFIFGIAVIMYVLKMSIRIK